MNRKPGIVICIVAAAVLVSGLACPQHASAENPFYYYPAYGAHRGKIVYRDGPFVNRQKIRWGNGLTAYGADVFNNAFGAATQILPLVLKDDGSSDADKSSGVTVKLPEHYTTELHRANDLLERSARLAGVDLGAIAAGGEGSGGAAELPPSRWDERFRNSTDPWEAVVPTPAPTPAPMPAPMPMPEPAPAPTPDPAVAPAPAGNPPASTTPQ
ncbi:MAG: hypothetical protein MUF06_20055 [Pirellulaceae bacterium]|nr:hypothetical protein [Pirellulaceae bacterium]